MEIASNSNSQDSLADMSVQKPLSIQYKNVRHFRQGTAQEGLSCSLDSETTSISRRSSLSKYFSKARSFSCLYESIDGPLGESAKALEKPAKRKRQACTCGENLAQDKSTKLASYSFGDISDLEDLCHTLEKCPLKGKDSEPNNSIMGDGTESSLRSESSCSVHF